MDTYSRLNGTTPISPASSGVWRIQKKRKTDDRKNRNDRKKGKRDKELIELEEKPVTEKPINSDTDKDNPGFEGQIVYGSLNKKKRVRGKVDLTI